MTILDQVLVAHSNLIDLKAYFRTWNLVQTCFGNCSLERTWYWTHTSWTCETTIVSLTQNIPREYIIFCDQLKTKELYSKLTHQIGIIYSWSVVLFDQERHNNLRKVEKHSIRCSDSFYYKRKDLHEICVLSERLKALSWIHKLSVEPWFVKFDLRPGILRHLLDWFWILLRLTSVILFYFYIICTYFHSKHLNVAWIVLLLGVSAALFL